MFDLRFSLESIFYIALLSVIFSVGIWFFKRVTKSVVSVPILRILDKNKASKLRIQPNIPPYLLLLPFLAIALLWLFVGSKPYQVREEVVNKPANNVYFLADYSPSTSVYFDVKAYADKILSWVDALESKGFQVYLDTTHASDDFVDKKDLLSLDFHMESAFLGEIVESRINKIPSDSIVVIFSDGEKSSWQGFNWQGLDFTYPVSLINMNSSQNIHNIFIDQIKTASLDKKRSLKLKIQSNKSGVATTGKILVTVKDGDKKLEVAQKDFLLERNSNKTEQTLQWFKKDSETKDSIYSVSIVEDGSGEKMSLDNAYDFAFGFKGHRMLVYSDISPESYLLDGSYYLKSFLESKKMHYEYTNALDKQSMKNKDQLILQVSNVYQKKDCSQVLKSSATKLWLAPYDQLTQFSNLCHCMSDFHSESLRCDGVSDAESFRGILNDLSAKPVGGELGLDASSLGYRLSIADKDMVVFLYPLLPAFSSVINYSNFASIMDKLIRWFFGDGLFTESPQQKEVNFGSIDSKRVMYQESLLSFVEKQQLPGSFEEKLTKSTLTDLSNKTTESDSIVLRVIYLFLALLVLEFIAAVFYIKYKGRG